MRPHDLREPQRSEEPLHVVERQAEERLAGGARAKLALNTSEAPALRPNGVDGFLAEVGPLRSGAAGPARSAASSFSHQHRCLRMSLNCSSRSPIRFPTRALVAPRQHAERDDAHELAAALQAVAASAPRPLHRYPCPRPCPHPRPLFFLQNTWKEGRAPPLSYL